MDKLSFEMHKDGVFTATEPCDGVIYQFEVKRKKDELTGLEVMEIIGGCVDNKNNFTKFGMIIAQFSDVSQKICELQNYGILLTKLQLSELGKVIKSNYNHISVEKTSHINNHIEKAAIKDFFQMICRHIRDTEMDSKDNLYCMEPSELKSIYEESSFQGYPLSEWKAALAESEYTKTNKNRNDYTIKIPGNKSKKVYAFYKKKVDEELEEIMKKKGEENE